MSQRAERLKEKGFKPIKMHGGVRGGRGVAVLGEAEKKVEALKAEGRRIRAKFDNSRAKRVVKKTLRKKLRIRLRRSDAPPGEVSRKRERQHTDEGDLVRGLRQKAGK